MSYDVGHVHAQTWFKTIESLQSVMQVQHMAGSATISLSDDVEVADSNTYFTHHNGGRPFRVQVRTNRVVVFDNYDDVQLCELRDPRHVFVGESPLTAMTLFSGGHGPAFKGNSILVETAPLEYVFVGSTLFAFTTDASIIRFVSEVGNNDVPYPYAIDELDRHYLFTEDVVLSAVVEDLIEDPYQALYRVPQEKYKGILDIEGFVGADPDETFRLTYHIDPAWHYDRPWMYNLHAVLKDGTRVPVSKNEYIDMMESVNSALGISKIRRGTLVPGGTRDS